LKDEKVFARVYKIEHPYCVNVYKIEQFLLSLQCIWGERILLRFFEASGSVRRAISVIKKRTGAHENTIREFKISSGGLSLGAPLHHFHGVLRGVPTYTGQTMPPLEEQKS
jgi:hypothetical protein